MRFDILGEKDNPLLKRKEIVLALDYEGGATPKKEELIQSLAEKFGVEKDFVDISKIISETGFPRGKAYVKVWQIKPPEKKKKIKGEKTGGGEEGKEAEKQKQT